MSQVTRYDLVQGDTEEGIAAFMEQHSYGDYVHYSDYCELEEENKRLRKAMEEARDILNV